MKTILGTTIAIILWVFICVSLFSCTENERAKVYGGTMTINLPRGQKLTTMTFKELDLWYATRPMREGEIPETTTFQEKSALGIVEGTVIFIESN
jgi:hypothetical protein